MPLSDEQALNLITKSSSADGRTPKAKPEYAPAWPSANEKLAILMAIKDGEDSVLLRPGMFTIRQGASDDTMAGDEGPTFFVKPEKGYIPCGWFSLKTLERELS